MSRAELAVRAGIHAELSEALRHRLQKMMEGTNDQTVLRWLDDAEEAQMQNTNRLYRIQTHLANLDQQTKLTDQLNASIKRAKA